VKYGPLPDPERTAERTFLAGFLAGRASGFDWLAVDRAPDRTTFVVASGIDQTRYVVRVELEEAE